MTTETTQHTLLPPSAQEALKRAAAKAATMEPETLARAVVVQDAIDLVKRSFPTLFRSER